MLYFGNFVKKHEYIILKRKPNILVCPLDWGIGHATRCVPVINELIRQNANVIIGADNRPLAFLKNEFPDLQFEKFPGYNFSYPGKGNMALKMFFLAPRIIKGIKKENKYLKEIVRKLKIDVVISDNRFGLWTEDIPCVFMTHQIMIKTPGKLKFFEPVLYKINKFYISKFNECWIPDFKGELNLSGELSHKKPLPANSYYIGPLSRFANKQTENSLSESTEHFKYDLMVMLSGPEPQRTILENRILEELKDTDFKAIIVSGKPEMIEEHNLNNNIKVFSHLESKTLKQCIIDSKVILSRPGYSTIMDLAALGGKAIFIPTSGQTEQEYLADHFYKKKIYFKMDQKEFNLKEALKNAEKYNGLNLTYELSVLKLRIQNLISMVSLKR
ncbi:MAG: glycosyltransferase [Bacteroidetes bacterium]|nr:glycosyltransferase [Bacteroidota bacterium]MBL7103430.1 glycosyltransferase [Bacteroidales bacterium]